MEQLNADAQKKRLEEFLSDLEFAYRQLSKSPQSKEFLECKELLEKAQNIQQNLNRISARAYAYSNSAGLIGELQFRFKKKVLKIRK